MYVYHSYYYGWIRKENPISRQIQVGDGRFLVVLEVKLHFPSLLRQLDGEGENAAAFVPLR